MLRKEKSEITVADLIELCNEWGVKYCDVKIAGGDSETMDFCGVDRAVTAEFHPDLETEEHWLLLGIQFS